MCRCFCSSFIDVHCFRWVIVFWSPGCGPMSRMEVCHSFTNALVSSTTDFSIHNCQGCWDIDYMLRCLWICEVQCSTIWDVLKILANVFLDRSQQVLLCHISLFLFDLGQVWFEDSLALLGAFGGWHVGAALVFAEQCFCGALLLTVIIFDSLGCQHRFMMTNLFN